MPTKMGRPKVDNPKDVRYSIRLRIPSRGLRPIVYVEMSQKAQPFVKPLNCYCCETKKVSAVTFEPRQRLLPKTPYPPRMMA